MAFTSAQSASHSGIVNSCITLHDNIQYSEIPPIRSLNITLEPNNN